MYTCTHTHYIKLYEKISIKKCLLVVICKCLSNNVANEADFLALSIKTIYLKI